jgi:hypothetical protein
MPPPRSLSSGGSEDADVTASGTNGSKVGPQRPSHRTGRLTRHPVRWRLRRSGSRGPQHPILVPSGCQPRPLFKKRICSIQDGKAPSEEPTATDEMVCHSQSPEEGAPCHMESHESLGELRWRAQVLLWILRKEGASRQVTTG